VARLALGVADVALSPLTVAGALWLRTVRRIGLRRMPLSRSVLRRVGLLPVRRHYYEPYPDELPPKAYTDDRELPGIDLNVAEQLAFLSKLRYGAELDALPLEPTGRREFHYHNGAFESGDAEYLYSIVRQVKPRRIFEIGSGSSTLVVRAALSRIAAEDGGYRCRHVCVEPYEQPWLEEVGVEVRRSRVEHVDPALFDELESGDILFIDSSHVIRPDGDVVHEYLQLLPRLRPGVLVHIHDIFTPRNYLAEWMADDMLLWDEQYLVEAFLTLNRDYRILGALNFLKHHHAEALCEACPVLRCELDRREPGSLWLIRN
jgi:predicted O-methyltransferase YrrM